MPESVDDRPTRSHEYLFLLSKSEDYYYDAGAIREPQTGGAHSRGKGITPKTVPGHHDQIKANESFHAATSAYTIVPGGRNRRSIWRIPVAKYAGAHYATFPEALIEPCILASTAARVCPTCGAARQRRVEATGHSNQRKESRDPRFATQTKSTNWQPTKIATEEMAPACRCDGNDGTGRSLVLDPFAGTGTAGRVCERFGRDFIGIEIKDEYLDLASERTNGVQRHMEALL
jgi:hypothetical protein